MRGFQIKVNPVFLSGKGDLLAEMLQKFQSAVTFCQNTLAVNVKRLRHVKRLGH